MRSGRRRTSPEAGDPPPAGCASSSSGSTVSMPCIRCSSCSSTGSIGLLRRGDECRVTLPTRLAPQPHAAARAGSSRKRHGRSSPSVIPIRGVARIDGPIRRRSAGSSRTGPSSTDVPSWRPSTPKRLGQLARAVGQVIGAAPPRLHDGTAASTMTPPRNSTAWGTSGGPVTTFMHQCSPYER